MPESKKPRNFFKGMLEVRDRDRHLEALRAARMGRQPFGSSPRDPRAFDALRSGRRREADAFRTWPAPAADARLTPTGVADAGRDLAPEAKSAAQFTPSAKIGHSCGRD